MANTDVKNQQNATTFSFINLFNSVLHVSDDQFSNPYEHILTVYTVLVQCTELLPTGTTVEMLQRIGEFVARNM